MLFRRFHKNAKKLLYFKGCFLMRTYVRTILASATVTAGILALSSPASAAVTLCYETGSATPKCALTNVNVLVNQQTANVVTASDNDATTNVTYDFRSSTEALLTQVASGQADVSSADRDGVIQQITFNIINGASDLITFNLLPLGPQSTGTDATSVKVTFIGAISGLTETTILNLSPSGNNFYGIQATGGDRLTGLSFGNFQPAGAGTGIQALNQVRLNLIPAVPEPATWMMMLLGMAGVGFSMRRKEKHTVRVRYA